MRMPVPASAVCVMQEKWLDWGRPLAVRQAIKHWCSQPELLANFCRWTKSRLALRRVPNDWARMKIRWWPPRGMMTTDTVHKLAGRNIKIGARTFQITGMCKGAAMIAPNMGTMLGLVLTDAPIAAADLQKALSAVLDDTFNCISIDGHMSTNDTVLVLANGAAGGAKLSCDELSQFQSALHEVCADLSKSIPADGEGATHLICIDVKGCAGPAAARKIAKSVADSPLVKTAIAGADPNWGRIVSAAGYAGVPFDPAGVDLAVNGFALYRSGAPATFDAEKVSASIKENRDTSIVLSFHEGNASAQLLDLRSHRRVCAAQCRLSHLIGIPVPHGNR